MRKNDRHNQENLVIPPPEKHYIDFRIYPVETERNRGLGIQELGRLQRVAPGPLSVQNNMFALRRPRHGPICVQSIQPARKLHELETRPIELSTGRVYPKLGQPLPLCLPSVQPHRENTQKGEKTQNQHDNSHTNLGNPTMVPPIARNGDTRPIAPPESQKPSDEPQKRTTSIINERDDEISGVANFRKSGGAKEISTTASSLIENARSVGTRKNYQSAWRKFRSWCSGNTLVW